MTAKRVLNRLKNYSYPRFFWGKETAGTVNSPFQLMHYLLKEGVVQLEEGDCLHEISWGPVPELKLIDPITLEVIEVHQF